MTYTHRKVRVPMIISVLLAPEQICLLALIFFKNPINTTISQKNTSTCNINMVHIDANSATALVAYQGNESHAVQATLKRVVAGTSGNKYRG